MWGAVFTIISILMTIVDICSFIFTGTISTILVAVTMGLLVIMVLFYIDSQLSKV